jgi:hypothetical protein
MFKYLEELSDTEVSEDYDEDMFFEGLSNLRELPNYQDILQQ